MKYTLLIDPEHPEEVVVHAHEPSALTEAIQALCENNAFELVGYFEKEMFRLNPSDVDCFTVQDNKVYALCNRKNFLLKYRLYELEKQLPHHFVKINQSCIANMKKIERFDASISGSLKVIFKNGYTDYISRRQLKIVKERLGL